MPVRARRETCRGIGWAVQDSNLRPPACRAWRIRDWAQLGVTGPHELTLDLPGEHSMRPDELTTKLTSSSPGLGVASLRAGPKAALASRGGGMTASASRRVRVSKRRGCESDDDSRSLVDEFIVLERLHHDQSEVHAAREVALKDRVAYVAAPDR